jgi:hypothetical protein
MMHSQKKIWKDKTRIRFFTGYIFWVKKKIQNFDKFRLKKTPKKKSNKNKKILVKLTKRNNNDKKRDKKLIKKRLKR